MRSGIPNAQVSQALSGAEDPDRPAEAAAPPSEGKGGLKQSTPKELESARQLPEVEAHGALHRAESAGRTTHQ